MNANEHYQGLDRTQAFVRRADDRLWGYCVGRHREHWRGAEGGKRSVPTGIRYEGFEGWWFPAQWLADFGDRHGRQVRTAKFEPPRNAPRVSDAMLKFAKGWSENIRLDELRSWGLPEGTMIAASGDVQYPDGTIETIDEIRLRKGRFRAVRTSPEQQNLERLLEMLHEKADAKPSEELASNKLTRANFAEAERAA